MPGGVAHHCWSTKILNTSYGCPCSVSELTSAVLALQLFIVSGFIIYYYNIIYVIVFSLMQTAKVWSVFLFSSSKFFPDFSLIQFDFQCKLHLKFSQWHFSIIRCTFHYQNEYILFSVRLCGVLSIHTCFFLLICFVAILSVLLPLSCFECCWLCLITVIIKWELGT